MTQHYNLKTLFLNIELYKLDFDSNFIVLQRNQINKKLLILNPIDISIIVPLYNEEAVFSTLIQRLESVINSTKFSCEVILINDGSSDKTAELICEKDKRFTGVLLSRNQEHQLQGIRM